MPNSTGQGGSGQGGSGNGNGGGAVQIEYPISQPLVPGIWVDSGRLTWFDGTANHSLDFAQGEKQSLFGTPLGDL